MLLSKFFQGKSEEINQRNFLAHSGLERNVTEIKLDKDALDKKYEKSLRKSIILRYTPAKHEKVMNSAFGGMRSYR